MSETAADYFAMKEYLKRLWCHLRHRDWEYKTVLWNRGRSHLLKCKTCGHVWVRVISD